MLSKNDILLISSLKTKKYRQKYNFFVVEGIKSIKELLKSRFEIKKIFSTKEGLFLFKLSNYSYQIVKEEELKKISFLSTPNKILALCELPKDNKEKDFFIKNWALALDSVSDPGNLGSILRLADWFGIDKIYASKNTVDFFSPKVIQASMGSFCRVEVIYIDLEIFFDKSDLPIWGAFPKGESVYNQTFPGKGILLLGGEANGISKNLEKYLQKKVSIPTYRPNAQIESLNVATATAILLSHLRKK